MITLSALWIYPVKSLRGLRVDEAALDDLGLVGDRRFMIVDEAGRFLTQRTVPKMALIDTALTSDTLALSAAGAGGVRVPRASDPSAPRRIVSVWRSEGLLAEDCGDEAAAWLGDFLGTSCHLVRAGTAFRRPLDKPGKAQPGDILSFADGYPLLAISEASLGDLNDRLIAHGEEPVPMERFRPNLVLSGAPAYAEDGWPRLRIGGAVFRAGGPCGRCVVVTTDPLTARRDPEPLRTLATYRRDTEGDVNFGQNLIHETKSALLRVGDPVAPL